MKYNPKIIIMDIKNTKLFFLEEDCVQQFGVEDGNYD